MDILPNLTNSLAGLRGPSFGGSTGAVLRLSSLSGGATSAAPGLTGDVVSLSAASGAPNASAPRALDDIADDLRSEARRRAQSQGSSESLAVRRDNLRERILLRARSGNIGEKAVESALARVDARFRGLEASEKPQSAGEPPAPPAAEGERSGSGDSARAASLKKHRLLVDKLRKSTGEIDARGKAAGLSDGRMATLKAKLHERVRASGAKL